MPVAEAALADGAGCVCATAQQGLNKVADRRVS
jgi:hypothetical protein